MLSNFDAKEKGISQFFKHASEVKDFDKTFGVEMNQTAIGL